MKIPKVTNKIQSIVLVKNEHNNIIHAYPVSLVKWVFLVVIFMVGGRISEVLRFVSLLQYGVPFKLQPSTCSPWLSWWLKSQCKNGNNNIEVIILFHEKRLQAMLNYSEVIRVLWYYFQSSNLHLIFAYG